MRRWESSEIAPVEYIPAATGNRAATVSTPTLAKPFTRACSGASLSVIMTVRVPIKTSHVGSRSETRTANIATSRSSVIHACIGTIPAYRNALCIGRQAAEAKYFADDKTPRVRRKEKSYSALAAFDLRIGYSA